ncbi:MAG TPA: hypothetical protein VN934_03690 [Candidatus Tumulicola sp.]|nr:hypothetical protein [Candidatus Tumulicola sp.]
MANFTVRVELHRASVLDYEVLHAAMEERGFSRTIAADSNETYKLPTAEYTISGTDRGQVLAQAKRAAGDTGKSFAALVTESAGRTWHGLEKG